MSARVHRRAAAGARRARKTPAYRGIRMPATRYRCLKSLRRAEFHARGIRRQTQRDVARNRHGACAGFCRIGMARGRDLHRRGRGQVSGRGVHAGRCDRSQRCISARHAADAPSHRRVRRVRYRSDECDLVSEDHRSIRWCHGHYNEWRRGRWRHAACTAAKRPRPLDKKCDDHNRRCRGTLSVAPREGPHAVGDAGEGPAKKEKLKMRIRQTVSETFR